MTRLQKWTTLKALSDNRNWLRRLFAAWLRNLGNSKSNLTAVKGERRRLLVRSMTRDVAAIHSCYHTERQIF